MVEVVNSQMKTWLTMRTWLTILVSLFQLSASTSVRSQAYVVEGLKLGERVPLGTPSYRSYTCKPSNYFEGYTWCQRTQPRSTSAGGGSLASTIMHAGDGTAVYLMAKVAPLSINRSAVQKEIDDLSKEIKERPAKVEWVPARPGAAPSVIALWGRVELRKLTSYEVEIVADGEDPNTGVLVDSLGDLVRSAKAGLPVYRIAGGAGYLYSASFDVSGRGHRRYVAVDISQPAIGKFEPALHEVLQKDQSLARDNYALWPEVALLTRNLALATSPAIANETLDKAFDKYPSKKLRSHVWSLLPLGSINNLAERAYWSISVYGPRTRHPEIRESIQKFLADHPSEPFSEFLYYTVGEFDKALQANPSSIIAGVLRYGIGHKMLEVLLRDIAKVVNIPATPDTDEPVNDLLVALNSNPALYDHKLLGNVVQNFAARAAAAQPWFEVVLRDEASPHRDDAAYMLGWLAFHQGKFKEALGYLSQAMALGNGDYRRPAALRQTVRIMARVPAREQIAIVESDPTLAQQPALWYMAARSAYRDFNYESAIETAQRGLSALKVPLDRLPATTDPQKITEALEKVEPKLDDDLNLNEMPYLVEASREILQYEAYLKAAATDGPDNVARKARAIIAKYSMLLDPPEQGARRRGSPELAHKDLRQAAHLIDMTLASVPKEAQHAPLREWLHYRKVRILVQFAPKTVPAAVAAMEQEFPKSQLMDDALAEQIYAEGVMLRDLSAAQTTFRKLLANYPKGNAVDNAYTWMAIVYRCTGRAEDAQKTNRDIIRLFPMTRHARYARDRASNPKVSACGLSDLSQR
jgi:tetratricopeptide (TPR) repeat protein